MATHRLPEVRAPSFALAALLALVSCGGPDEAVPERPAGASPADAEAATAGGPADAPGAVGVTLEEYTIAMPDRLPAGRTVLRIANRGFEEHNLGLRAAGSGSTVWRTEGNVPPGGRLEATVELAAGTYTVLCDFAGHDARGMTRTLVVGGGG